MRQFKPGQLQTGSLYNISSSYALTASFATNLNPNATASYAINAETASYVNPLRQNVQITGSLYFPDNTHSIYFSGSGAASRLTWNDTDGTLELGLKGGIVQTEIGQGLVTRVVNKTTPNIDLSASNYQVVVVSGAQGQRLAVKLAQADNDANSAGTLGIIAEDIAKNQEGFIITVGLLKNRNTTGALQGETWSDGDILYLSPITPGAITNIKPQAPQHTVIVGYVEYAHANNGKIYVKIDNGYELDELHNVRITTSSLSSGDLLVYSGSVWANTKQLTGSYGLTGSLTATTITASNAQITGNVQILGTASISVLNVTYESASIIYSSGSNQFGDAANDTQTLWGTVDVKSGPLLVTGSIQSTAGFTGSFSGSVAAPGLNTQIVYNRNGVLSADENFIYTGSYPNNFVGINSPTPLYSLDVNGAIYQRTGELLITTSGSVNKEGPFIASSGGTNRTTQLGIQDNSVVPVGIDMFATNNSFPSSYLNFRVNNADLVRMTGSFVGIGTTTPSYKLDVSGSGNFTNNLTVTGSTTLTNGQTTIRGTGVTSATTALRVENSNSTPTLVALDNGYVGIGTLTPSASLQISGSNPLLRLNGSGSELMSVDGASGRLFTVSDDLSNSLFSVNTISGLPVIEAYATNDVYIGKFNTYPIKTTASGTLAVITGSFTGSMVGSIIGTASFATQALTASFASTASYLNTLNQNLTFNGNLTLNGTASISTLIINQTQYSSGSNQLGDAANDTQTLYGSVIIPTGSLTVSGSSTFTAQSNATPLTITGYVATGSAAQPAIDISGSWSTSGTPTLIRVNITNTSSNNSSLLMDLRRDGTSMFSVGQGGIVRGTFYNGGSETSNTLNTGFARSGGNNNSSGTHRAFVSNMLVSPTTGTAVFNHFEHVGIVSQSGGANGITRAFYANPTLTSAADWRSIEWSNNTGFGLYGAGGATNYLSGSLGIGTTTPSASLHISGASAANLLRIDSPASSSILFVSGSGNVGIGTLNPINPFDVFVTGSFGTSVPIASLRTTATSGYLSFYNWTNPFEISRIESSNDISNGGSLRFYTKNTAGTMAEKVRVHGAGDVSIGSTTTSARLQVRGSGATSATTTLRIENSSASPSLTITDDLNSQFFGNVGVRRTATASLDVAGTTRISGSFNTAASGSILTVIGSGSAQPIFTVQGSQGELFSITDSLSGSLFSVNDISGLPILEVFSDNTTLIGNYQDPMLITTAKLVTTASGAFTLYALPTASYDTAFFEYSIRSGSNARAGTIMAMQLGTAVNFTETTTTDHGSTSALGFTVQVTGSNMILTGSATTSGWTIKTIVRGL